MADPNYGYAKRYDDALGLMRGVKPAKLLFMEEIFPENPELYARLRSDLAADGDPCKIAFGEHFTKTDAIDPYLKPRMLVDFAQPDVRTNGILDFVAIGRKCEAAGTTITGHNWASQLGAVMTLHLSRALPNYGPAENDRSTCEVFDLEPLKLKNGCATVPPGAGLGVNIRKAVYDRDMAPKEIVVS
jgi:L-alanine-DL-glutamate epimerase-like enolase superfamily enzyme